MLSAIQSLSTVEFIAYLAGAFILGCLCWAILEEFYFSHQERNSPQGRNSPFDPDDSAN